MENNQQVEREKIELKSILEQEDLIIADTCIRQSTNFYWNLGEVRRPEQLYPLISKMGTETRNLRKAREILSAPNIATIEEICQEYVRICEHIGACTGYLDNRGLRDFPDLRDLLQELSENAFNTWKIANRKQLCKRNGYVNHLVDDSFFEMIRTLEDQLHIKRDTTSLYGKHISERSKDSVTDERITSCLFSLVMNRKPSSVITGDTDLIKLLGIGLRMICSQEFYPLNANFQKLLKEGGIKLYFTGDKINYELAIDTKREPERYIGNRDFSISRLSEQENNVVISRFKSLWHNIYMQSI